jgi:hypothetical protein
MSKKDAKEGEDRIVIYTRIKSSTVQALDEIRDAMAYTPTRAQVIDVALAEYVEKHGKRAKESTAHR